MFEPSSDYERDYDYFEPSSQEDHGDDLPPWFDDEPDDEYSPDYDDWHAQYDE